ncbi:CD3324 family protein [Lachnospiraceae bacterium SGI.066]
MSYPKIYEVLPKDIILQIQDYIEGEVIYIPKRSENKKSWGDCTDTKEILSLRNKKIYYDYCDGISVQQLAQKYFLAEKSIQRIIRYEKNNSVLHNLLEQGLSMVLKTTARQFHLQLHHIRRGHSALQLLKRLQ